MIQQGSFITILIVGGLFAALLVLGVRTVRRIAATDPTGQHWLLRVLALLSPLCLVAGLAIGMIGPYLNDRAQPAHGPGLLTISMLLMLAGALALPVLWRMMLQRRLGRPANGLPFFHASRTSLLVLYVLAAVYMMLIRNAGPNPMPWLMDAGLVPTVAWAIAGLLHLAMLSVLITLPLMLLRAVMIGVARRITRPFTRSSGL
ncbi:hypothetical protein [Stenotrophomonas maltophilia]|uniref:Transmembrane protein n=1 Tax=Stenotrophomonas maltophilia TaxID=40324 RepID=A0AAJ2JC85_STEMA|nr:hypothetical protein [Stenotrophomonas maltophilia]MDT3469060.1 hypothetical protein [Stenotrophomonas maltophilia]